MRDPSQIVNTKTLMEYFTRRNLSQWDAEDLVQDVMLKILKMGRSLNSDEQGYIFTVARTLLIDKYRSDSRHKTTAHVSLDPEQAIFDEHSGPEYQFREHQVINILANNFKNLTELQQETFIDSKVYGKRLQEIAECRKVSVSAVEKVISKAYRSMKVGVACEPQEVRKTA